MKGSVKNVLKTLLPLALGGILVWYSLSKISLETLWYYFKEAHYGWVALGLFFGVLSHLSRAYRWKFLLEPLGYKPNFGNSVMAVLIAYLVNLTIPRAGEVSRAAVMTNYEGIPFEKGLGTIVAERIADLVMMLIIIIFTLFIQFDFIYDLIAHNFNLYKIALVLLGLAIALFVFFRLVNRAESGFLFRVKTFVNGLIQGMLSIFRMKTKGVFIFHTVFIWLMYIAMFWATIPSIENLNVPFGAVLVGFIAGGFSIAATNGGIGLYPIAVAGAFTLFSIPEELANAFGWIMWTAQTAMIIIFGGLSFLFISIYNKKR